MHTNHWLNFYNNIRDDSWPDCYNEYHFHTLPGYIQNEIMEKHNGSDFLYISDQDLEFAVTDTQIDHPIASCVPNFESTYPVGPEFFVYYDEYMDGGGTEHGQDYPRIIRYLYPDREFSHCLDWCAGAGFIGFRLLADKICQEVTFLESHKPCVLACEMTINHLPHSYQNCAKALRADSLIEIDEQFDLVVGNPPPRSKISDFNESSYRRSDWNNYVRVMIDQDWKIHKDFFANIQKKLAPDGVVILINNIHCSTVQDFEADINNGGLMITKVFREKKRYPYLWYLVMEHRVSGKQDFRGQLAT